MSRLRTLVTRRRVLVGLNALVAAYAFLGALGWALLAFRPFGPTLIAALWYLPASSLLLTAAFGIAAIAHARGWRGRWLVQTVAALVLVATLFGVRSMMLRSDHATAPSPTGPMTIDGEQEPFVAAQPKDRGELVTTVRAFEDAYRAKDWTGVYTLMNSDVRSALP